MGVHQNINGYTASPANRQATKQVKEQPAHIKAMERLYQSFTTGVRLSKSEEARRFLKDHALDYDTVPVAFCSGQFHHRKPDEALQPLVNIGFLKVSASPGNQGRKAYESFGKNAIIFPLKDADGCITNFCAIRLGQGRIKAEYLNSSGLYPGYPPEFTRRLYITASPMEAASLLQSKTLQKGDEVMALFDGELKGQHLEAINSLGHLEEIIHIII